VSGERPPAELPASATLTIESIAAGGDGVARAGEGGLVVFVPRTAPGDTVRARLASAGRFARGAVEELVHASDARVEPPCPHYVADRCGGCQLQHMAYDAQLAAKRAIVGDALARIGRRDVVVSGVRASPAQWRYRRKLTLAIRRRGPQWIAGLHAYDRPGNVFALRDCPITDERVVAVWRAVMAASRHLPRDARELRGAVRLLDAGAAFTLEGGARWDGSAAFFAAVPSLEAVWWVPEKRGRRLLHDRRAEAVPGASFVQVNPAVAESLRDEVVRRTLAHAPAHVVDAYSGSGETAVRLAQAGARVTAIELDREAARWAGERLPEGSRSIAGPVEGHLAEALPADVVIVNPPRGGLDARVPAVLEQAAAGAPGEAPRAVIYVSCNPATLARDLARMPSWTLRSAEAFDMFPQTAHVETVCELVPTSR
jgi:23S rRNA (uracil1939-C5)-methyltransferase